MPDNLKIKILTVLERSIDQKIADAKTELAELEHARNEETKSSMGDKYETSRTMVQMEIDSLENQISNHYMAKNTIETLKRNKKSHQIESGSLINSNIGQFYISIALGAIDIEDVKVFCVSPTSPIAQHFLNKKKGDQFSFQNKTIEILDVN